MAHTTKAVSQCVSQAPEIADASNAFKTLNEQLGTACGSHTLSGPYGRFCEWSARTSYAKQLSMIDTFRHRYLTPLETVRPYLLTIGALTLLITLALHNWIMLNRQHFRHLQAKMVAALYLLFATVHLCLLRRGCWIPSMTLINIWTNYALIPVTFGSIFYLFRWVGQHPDRANQLVSDQINRIQIVLVLSAGVILWTYAHFQQWHAVCYRDC